MVLEIKLRLSFSFLRMNFGGQDPFDELLKIFSQLEQVEELTRSNEVDLQHLGNSLEVAQNRFLAGERFMRVQGFFGDMNYLPRI